MLQPIFSRAGDGFTARGRHALKRAAIAACAVVALVLVGTAKAVALELPVYEDGVLAEWQQRYPPGILSNYEEVILPRVDPDERRFFDDVVFQFPLNIKAREPFAFATDGQNRVIYMSIQSLKFLDDLSIADAWLNRNGYSQESLYNYLTMLRNWQAPEPPPPVLSTLCVPENVLDDPDVDSLSQKSFATSIVFIMLHELGHVYLDHGGYEGVDPSVARQNESDADAYALKILARIGDVPLGVVNMFLTMAYLHESRQDFSSDSQHELRLAARTHPLSAERLRDFADALEATAADYTGGGLSRVQIIATAAQIRIVAQNFLDIQQLTAILGQSIKPDDLGPVRPGEKLGRPCKHRPAADVVFSGSFRGIIVVNNVEFDLDAEMARSGDNVRGRSNYGLGVSEFEGIVDGDTLHYRWRLGRDAGRGRLIFANGAYEGTWGINDSESNGGAMRLSAN
ncbi:MAG: M48 family metalloprotease [Hyphomicrobiales bacterium]|nr:M48 family metalloprotease [Hyphomicrobiales bacterium]MCP4998496.1 M48 family metalloprotease [Hyphomicrobiales bacterium]